ncbi:hypothetical protein [Carnobacterium sp.]|uniref:hypothetical protein n=1 Tax=Carnobacterium sp. TaxID=48221 RepID=UPI00388DE715
MKKLSMTLTILMGLFILTSCGTSNEDEEASSQSSVAQSISSSSSSSKESAESASSTPTSDGQNESSSSSSLEEPAESTSSSSESSEETTDSTPSAPENVINSEEEAFAFIKEQTGIEANNTDIVYGLLESDENSYTLRLVSQSLREQGGSGTAGIYKVYKDGTYEIVA